MATAEQLKALVRSHGEGDDARFYAVAVQVAAEAARKGQHRFAQDLRDLVDAAKDRAGKRPGAPVPVVRPKGELAGLLSASYPETRLSDMALQDSVRGELRRLLLEQRQRDQLRHHGFEPLRKLLFIGPPGTGKTMAASAVASELRLPLFATRLDGLITKFMGETAAKLRLVFDAIAEMRGVYFFDEVDAVASDRLAGNDVGEIRRVLNSFLQFLEQDASDSLILAATNHPQLLDAAVFRRFETVVRFTLPERDEIRQLVKNRLSAICLRDIGWAQIEDAAKGLSHADVSMACEKAAKDAILSGKSSVTTSDLVQSLRARTTG
jgi:SpoVK/Ycf46/Vps4 family AAA+-type ATPase